MEKQEISNTIDHILAMYAAVFAGFGARLASLATRHRALMVTNKEHAALFLAGLVHSALVALAAASRARMTTIQKRITRLTTVLQKVHIVWFQHYLKSNVEINVV